MGSSQRAFVFLFGSISVAACGGGGDGSSGSSGSGGTGNQGGGSGSGGAGASGSGGGGACAGIAQCSTPGSTCDGDTIVHCAANLDGCLVETRTHCGAFGQVCDASAGPAACMGASPCDYIHPTDRCDTADERTCAGDMLEVCTERSDGCLKIERVFCASTSDGFCDDTGAFAVCVDPIDYCDLVPPEQRCDTEGLSCDGSVLVDCAPNSFDCLQTTGIDCAASGEACVPGAPPACVDLCSGVDCSSWDDHCNAGVCNIATGACERDPFPDGTTCPDDICGGGTCTAGVCGPRLCDYGYLEDFELSDGGWITGGTSSSWAWGLPTDMPKPPGGNKVWGTNLGGDYNSSENSYIESPRLDMSSATADPHIRLALYWHTEGCCDQGWLEVSTDGGQNFSRVPNSAGVFNWYNDTTDVAWNGSAAAWKIAQGQLVGTAGQPDVRLRLRFESDSSIEEPGFALDSVLIRTDLGDDLALVGLSAGTDCPTGAQPLQVTVTNLGAVEVTSFDLAITVNGGTPVIETITTPISANATTVSFATTHTFDFTAGQMHQVEATISLPGDTVPSNDIATLEVPGVISLSTAYSESFDGGDGGWVGTGSWTHGTPTKAFITGPASGTGAWATSLASIPPQDEDSWVMSPCFDASGLGANPTLSFSHIFQLDPGAQYFAMGWFEVWTGSTNNWTRIGAWGSGGTNWYNGDIEDAWWGTSGAAGAWRTASHVLPGVAGQNRVRVRHRFENDSFNVTWDGFGLDDVVITPP